MSGAGPAAEASTGTRPGLLLAAVLAAVAAAHSPSVHGPPVWDDHQLVAGPTAPRGLDPVRHLQRPFMPNQGGGVAYYRPATTYSYAIDREWGGGEPAAFHATNLALHLAAVVLLYLLTRRRGAGPASAAAAAAAFGLLPRLTESVDWIAGRTDPLAAVLVLAALLLHRSEPGALGRRAAAALALLAGLLAKEVALAGLAALAAAEWAQARTRGTGPLRAALNLLPACTAAAAYLALRIAALGASPPVAPAVLPGPGGRLRLVVQSLGQYLLMLLDPLRPRLRIGRIDQVELLPLALGAVAVALLAWAALRLLRAPEPGAASSLALAVAALLPVLHAVPLVLTAVAADRFLYLPAAGLALLAAPALDRLARGRPRAFAAGAALAGAALAVATHARAQDWADEQRLWERAVATASPLDPVPLHEMAMLHVRTDRPEQALPFLARATRLVPAAMRPDALSDEAAVLSDLGRNAEARARLEEALAERREGTELLYNLALVELRDLRLDEAQAALRRLSAVRPGHPGGRAVEALLQAVRREFGDLGPESANESPDQQARRALYQERVGLPRLAVPRWLLVARAGSEPELVLTAVSRLIRAGRVAEASEALERATALGGDPLAVARLRQEMTLEKPPRAVGSARAP